MCEGCDERATGAARARDLDPALGEPLGGVERSLARSVSSMK
jgi:hypothetical protein